MGGGTGPQTDADGTDGVKSGVRFNPKEIQTRHAYRPVRAKLLGATWPRPAGDSAIRTERQGGGVSATSLAPRSEGARSPGRLVPSDTGGKENKGQRSPELRSVLSPLSIFERAGTGGGRGVA
ncbi:hypothetical protein NDU88_001665 [Pleurodeles waltl]|uniref:Uncharacterized protein n=1 Tax=Pleurodeles waltl TaxID=8319 RepID=A0AAV7LBN2_PLEWA|nr:hypothetical protein NDU88_001665 [Pleurodeles waltl]